MMMYQIRMVISKWTKKNSQPMAIGQLRDGRIGLLAEINSGKVKNFLEFQTN